ncbi:MAG: ABC transporter ATP-binding protein [Acidimicrobiales bacterium]|jgi:peptide/nickel transport system ATP-binding protein
MSENGTGTAVTAENLTRHYRVGNRLVRALENVSFEVGNGETLAVIGESGSGKSTLTRLITGLEPPTAGTIVVSGATPHLRPGVPARAQLVFQDPAGSLNPYRKVWKSVAEPLRHVNRDRRKELAGQMLARVGIEAAHSSVRPGRLSGGQLQRVAIARALVSKSDVLVCDEPTSALDVSVQAQILNLLQELQAEIGFTCIFVTHDLAVAQVVADKVMVLRHGRVCELGDAKSFFAGPQDPYSVTLLEATSRGHRLGGSEFAGDAAKGGTA